MRFKNDILDNLIINLGQFNVDTRMPVKPEVDPDEGLEITIDRITLYLVLDADFDTFDDTKRDEFLNLLVEHFEIEPNQLVIDSITSGSVILAIEPVVDRLQAEVINNKAEVGVLQSAFEQSEFSVTGSKTEIETYHHECELVWASSDGKGWNKFLSFTAGTEISTNENESSMGFFTDVSKWLLADEGDGSSNYLNLLSDSITTSENTSNALSGNSRDSIAKDFLRHLANQAMGGYSMGAKKGVTDIFNNESELLENIENLNEQINYRHKVLLFKSSFGLSYEEHFSKYPADHENSGNIIIPDYQRDDSGIPFIPGYQSKVENREKEHSNLGYSIFTKMINSRGMSRLTDDLVNNIVITDDNVYDFPILKAGDTLVFNLKLQPKNDTFATNSIQPRIYKIKLILQTAIKSLVYNARIQLLENVDNPAQQYYLYNRFKTEVKDLLYDGSSELGIDPMTDEESKATINLRKIVNGIERLNEIYSDSTVYDLYKATGTSYNAKLLDLWLFLEKEDDSWSNNLYYEGKLYKIVSGMLIGKQAYELVDRIVSKQVRQVVMDNLPYHGKAHSYGVVNIIDKVCDLYYNIVDGISINNGDDLSTLGTIPYNTVENWLDSYEDVINYLMTEQINYIELNDIRIETMTYDDLIQIDTTYIISDQLLNYNSYSYENNLAIVKILLPALYYYNAVKRDSIVDVTDADTFTANDNLRLLGAKNLDYLYSLYDINIVDYVRDFQLAYHTNNTGNNIFKLDLDYTDHRVKLLDVYNYYFKYVVGYNFGKFLEKAFINKVYLRTGSTNGSTQYSIGIGYNDVFTRVYDTIPKIKNMLDEASNKSNTQAMINYFSNVSNYTGELDPSCNTTNIVDNWYILKELALYEVSDFQKQKQILESLTYLENQVTDASKSVLIKESHRVIINTETFESIALNNPSKLLRKSLDISNVTLELYCVNLSNYTPTLNRFSTNKTNRKIIMFNDNSNNKYNVSISEDKIADLSNDASVNIISERFNLTSSYTGGYNFVPATPLNTNFKIDLSLNLNATNDFVFTGYDQIYPSVNLIKGFTYCIDLNNTDNSFSIHSKLILNNNDEVSFNEMNNHYYYDGLIHKPSDGSSDSSGIDAQNKTSGVLEFTVPYTSPYTLYYVNKNNNLQFGSFNILNDNTLFDVSMMKWGVEPKEFIDLSGAANKDSDNDDIEIYNPELESKYITDLEIGHVEYYDTYILGIYNTIKYDKFGSHRDLRTKRYSTKEFTGFFAKYEKDTDDYKNLQITKTNETFTSDNLLKYFDDTNSTTSNEYCINIIQEDVLNNSSSIIANIINGHAEISYNDVLYDSMIQYSIGTLEKIKEKETSFSSNIQFIINKIESLYTTANKNIIYTLENSILYVLMENNMDIPGLDTVQSLGITIDANLDTPENRLAFLVLVKQTLSDTDRTSLEDLFKTFDFFDEPWIIDMNTYAEQLQGDVLDIISLQPFNITLDFSAADVTSIDFTSLSQNSDFITGVIDVIYEALSLPEDTIQITVNEVIENGNTWNVN